MAETLKLNILSPERRLVENLEVESVTLPGAEGMMQVLPGHVPMIGSLTTGIFTYQPAGKPEQTGFLSTGFFEVDPEGVSVMAETIELRGEIDLDRAKLAQKKAETALQGANLDEASFRKYQLKLQRSLVRQQIAVRE